MDVALIFPGQGTQAVGMGRDLYDSSKEAKEVFDKANSVIDGLTDVIFNGPQEKLTETKYCQPAIVATSIAALTVLKSSGKIDNANIKFTCGLSLGEYSSLVAAEALSFENTIKLIEKRGAFMDEACSRVKGGMAAVIGMDKDRLIDICKTLDVEVANFNSPDQIVISGEFDKVENATGKIKESGAKRVIPLTVAGAFHSSLMKPAADKFREVLVNTSFDNVNVPIVSNVSGTPVSDSSQLASNLEKQITSSVQWVDSIEYIKANGVSTFIEIGPGSVLKGLLRKIDRELKVHSISSMDDIEKLEI